jgi:hypothetical protein
LGKQTSLELISKEKQTSLELISKEKQTSMKLISKQEKQSSTVAAFMIEHTSQANSIVK